MLMIKNFILLSFTIIVFISMLCLVYSPTIKANSQFKPESSKSKILITDSIVEKVIKEFQIPGVAIAVVKDQQVILSKGYGLASIKSKKPVDQNTLFKIASNSKAFTAASLALLVQQGKLRWEDKVIEHLPNFKMYNEAVTQQFNIIDLLTHRSGLRIGAGDLMLWPEPTKFTRQDVIENLRYLKPVSEFRKKYAYDNLLYIVAGEVVAKVSGMSWEEYVEQNIFKPLAMDRCFAGGVTDKQNTNSVAPHAVVDNQLIILEKNIINNQSSIMAAAGGVKCSANDLAKWVNMLLTNDNSLSLITDQQKRQLWKPRTTLRLSTSMKKYDQSTFHSYALGWRISDYFGLNRVSHTGMLGGSMSQIVLLPQQNLGIVVLTNQQSGAGRSAIVRSLLQLYSKTKLKRKTDWVAKYVGLKTQGQQSNTNNQIDLLQKKLSITERAKSHVIEARLGYYNDPWFGKVSLKKNQNGITFISEMSPRLIGDVYWHNENRWWVHWHDRSFEADAWIDFSANSKDQPTRMTMKPISSKTDFSFDFEDLFFTKLDTDNDNGK